MSRNGFKKLKKGYAKVKKGYKIVESEAGKLYDPSWGVRSLHLGDETIFGKKKKTKKKHKKEMIF